MQLCSYGSGQKSQLYIIYKQNGRYEQISPKNRRYEASKQEAERQRPASQQKPQSPPA